MMQTPAEGELFVTGRSRREPLAARGARSLAASSLGLFQSLRIYSYIRADLSIVSVVLLSSGLRFTCHRLDVLTEHVRL